MSKTIFKITYAADGSWHGTMEGGELLISSPTQEVVKIEVFKRARDLGNARVLIFNGAGDETQERTFGEPRVKGTAGNWD